MPATIRKRASARRDLVEQYVYLAEHAGIETAERFLANADESFRDLSRHPGLGVALLCESRSSLGCANGPSTGLRNF